MSRVLWLVFLAVMLAAGVGIFGSGPLVHVRAGDPEGPLWVEYDRIVRFGAPMRLVVHAAPQPNGSIAFTVDHPLLEALRVQSVTPAPAAATILEGGVRYRFDAAGRAGSRPVIFEMQPSTRGNVRGQVRSPRVTVEITQFVLP